MKAFLASVIVTILISGGAMIALERVQAPADSAFATSGVRLQ